MILFWVFLSNDTCRNIAHTRLCRSRSSIGVLSPPLRRRVSAPWVAPDTKASAGLASPVVLRARVRLTAPINLLYGTSRHSGAGVVHYKLALPVLSGHGTLPTPSSGALHVLACTNARTLLSAPFRAFVIVPLSWGSPASHLQHTTLLLVAPGLSTFSALASLTPVSSSYSSRDKGDNHVHLSRFTMVFYLSLLDPFVQFLLPYYAGRYSTSHSLR